MQIRVVLLLVTVIRTKIPGRMLLLLDLKESGSAKHQANSGKTDQKQTASAALRALVMSEPLLCAKGFARNTLQSGSVDEQQ